MNNISFLAVLSLLSSSYAFQHTFLSRSVSSAQGRVAPLHGVISSNDASIASDICNPFGDTVCPPAGDAAGAVEEISKNVIPTPDLSGVAASVGESINSVKLPKAPPLPSNVNVNLDFSTLKPGPQAGEGFEKLKSNFAGMNQPVGSILKSIQSPNIPDATSARYNEGLAKLIANFKGEGGDVAGSGMPMPNFPPLPSTFSLLEIQSWMASLDDVTSNYLFGGLLFTSFVLLSGNKDSAPATATATAPAPPPPPATPPAPAPTPAAATESVAAPAAPAPAPSKPKPLGKPGNPLDTLKDSRMMLMQMEQAENEAKLQQIKSENEAMKRKINALQASKESAPPAPVAKAPVKRAKAAARPLIDAKTMDTLKGIDGPNAQPPKIAFKEPAPAPSPVAPTPAVPADPLAQAKAAAERVAAAAAPPSADWSELSDAALKKKTVVELKAFITSNGGKPPSKAVKADLIKQVKGILLN